MKHAKKNAETRRSQGGPSSSRTGQAARKSTSSAATLGVARGPASCLNLTDSMVTAPTTRSRMQRNASSTLRSKTRERKNTEPIAQRAGERQKPRQKPSCPLTTEDIPTIVRAVRDVLPEPDGTPQGSHTLDNTLDTKGTISSGSDELGTWSCLATYCVCMYAL